MSRLWPRPDVRIALTPGHVAVADGKVFRESAVAAPGWPGAIRTLNGLLADGAWRGRADVVLSHHFAHVHCLPAPPLVLKPAEMQGWARDCLERQFGEAGRDWQLAWQSEAPGKPFLVSSIAASMLAELQESFAAAALKPASIQPWLAAAWNRNRRRFADGRAWYALVEPGRLMLASVASGHIHGLRTAPVQGDSVASLADLVRREALLAGEDEDTPLWVDSVLVHAGWRELGKGVTVNTLTSGGETLASMLGG